MATELTARLTPRASETWVLVASILGSSMAFIDGTAVNVMLPVLQHDLGASVAEVQWVVEAYALFLSALLLAGGSLGDVLGHRRAFVTGVVVFAAASMACGLAASPTHLIVARAVQGAGSALLTPGSLALIGASFADDRRGKAIGTWSSFTAVMSAIGPLAGGWLAEHASWRWVFFLNVPIAIAVVAICQFRVPETHGKDAKLDPWGALLATLGLGAIVYGLIRSGAAGLSAQVVAAEAAGGLLLAAFVVVEARSPAPMLPLALFRARTFRGANVLTFLLYAALGGLLFFLPFCLIEVHGYSPTAAGAAFLPFVVIMFFGSRIAGATADRYGARPLLIAGPLVAAVGFVLFALPGATGGYLSTFFPAVVTLAVGMTITVAPLTTAAMSTAGKERAGIASGVNNAVARTAGLIAIAALGLVARPERDPTVFLAGFREVMGICAALALGAAASAALLIEKPRLTPA